MLFRGKPLAGVDVESGDGVTAIKEADIPRFKTDEEGIAVIPIVKVGPVLLAIDHRVTPSGTPTDHFNGTFAFRMPAAPRARR